MKFESLPSDLQAWFRESIGRGSTPESLTQLLRATGYASQYAKNAVACAFAKLHPLPGSIEAVAESSPGSDAQPNISTSAALVQHPNTVETTDRKIDILFVLNAPRILLFGGLLAPEECEQLIELSRPKLSRSGIVNPRTGAFEAHPDRTSSDTHFQVNENALISKIENRIAELIGFPIENGEPLQILHYAPGAQYKPHFDFFEPALAGNEGVLSMGMGGQRMGSLVMYLNNVEAGGSTIFPEIGLDVLPHQGNAVYFAYATEDGELDRRSLHGGSPVTAGEKWIATKFFRQWAYSGKMD